MEASRRLQSPTSPRRVPQSITEPHRVQQSPTDVDDAVAGSMLDAVKAIKAAPQDTAIKPAPQETAIKAAPQLHSLGDRYLGGNFKLGKKLGSGAFGEVYLGNDAKTGEGLAVKMESVKSKTPQLLYEAKLYKILAGGVGIPSVHWCGVEGVYNIMVMDLMGPSLEDLVASCKRKFRLKTTLMIADQLVKLVEYVHSKNLVHRDIKPDNFLIGTGKNAHQLYIIDFGLAKKYRDPKTKQHNPYQEGKPLLGTARYASVNTHLGIEQSRRDDLEAVGHMLLYFIRGSLPWQGIQANSPKEKTDKIMQCKVSTPVASLCQGFPGEFATYLKTCRNLPFDAEPDYSYLRKMFKDLFAREGYQYDFIFDWSRSSLPSIRSSEQENTRRSLGRSRTLPARTCIT